MIVEPIVATDIHGKEHSFMLTAAALLRVARRLKALAKDEEPDPTMVGLLSTFITVWEARVDRTGNSKEDEEAFFELFTTKQVRGIIEQLNSEHQPARPQEPLSDANQVAAANSTATKVNGIASGDFGPQ